MEKLFLMDGSPSWPGVLNYFNTERTKFEEYFSRARKSLDIEGIHEYRLCLKRIRALFHLIEYVTNSEFEAEVEFLTLRKVFKAGALLRDTHVHLEIIGDFEKEPGPSFDKVTEYLQMDEISAERRFLRKTRLPLKKEFHRLEKLLKKRLKHISDKQFNGLAYGWVVSELDYLGEIHEFIYDPQVFHRFRRHQKETFYMIDFINGFTTGKVEIKGSLQSLKDIAKKIGVWHDYHLLLLRIRLIRLFRGDKRLKIYKECLVLEEQLQNGKDILFDELTEALKDTRLFRLRKP